MTPLWTADQLESITQGRWLSQRADVTGVAYLPRRVKPGDLYVAITYEGIDHHNDVAAAFRQGARAAMVTRMPPGVPPTAPLLAVPKLGDALWQLAAANRRRAQGKFIGITGRAGKTTTKDTTALVLSRQQPTQATEGNDNDFPGVALTLARCHPAAPFQVVEMSMAQYGDVAKSVGLKSAIVRPHAAIITRISGIKMDSEAQRKHHLMIASAKALIFQGLVPGGVGLINRDDQQVFEFLQQRARELGVSNLHTYGANPAADIRLEAARRTPTGFDVAVRLHGRPLNFAIGVAGRQFLENTLAVLGAVHAVGADVEKAAAALADVQESPGRGNRYEVAVSGGTATLVDYTRNVTLAALHASIELLTELTPGPGGRRILVVSDFMDLDTDLVSFRADMGEVIARAGIDLVFGVQEGVKPLYERLPPAMQAGYADTSEGIAPRVQECLRAGDVVLLQGRRMFKLYRIVIALVGKENYVPWF